MRMSPSNQSPRITVLTPTFNRVQLLSRIHQSLVAQTGRDFEWIVVDDGSTDGTGVLVQAWAAESPFPIRYVWQENAGKHVAVNRGVQLARGELLLILDSDDWLVPNALARVGYWWGSIPEAQRDEFAGVAGLCAFPSGEVVGTRFPNDVLDSNSIEVRVRYRVQGDKCEVWRTDVLRQHPFPEDLGSFVTEGLVWNRIARRYGLRFVNEVWMVKEYQPHGLSARSLELRVGSPQAAKVYYKEFAETPDMGIPFTRRLREYANFTRFSLHGQIPLAQQAIEVRFKGLWAAATPIGFLLYLRDRLKLGGQRRRR